MYPERCWHLMQPSTYDILRSGAGASGHACIDAAIWDAFGKALGLPLFRLWGAYREELPIIVIGGYYGLDRVQIMEQMQRYVQMGFAGCKFKVGGAAPKEDAERVKAAREAAGNDFILLVDANPGLHP